jgi:transposase
MRLKTLVKMVVANAKLMSTSWASLLPAALIAAKSPSLTVPLDCASLRTKRISASPTDLDPWTAAAIDSPLSSFAKGIIADRDAVQAAIIQPWSNGQTEGQITKLKLVKRQMYGRAKIDLLEARVIGAA